MATITQLQGALIADLVYNDLSTLVNQLNETEDAHHNKYTTLAFFLVPKFYFPRSQVLLGNAYM